MREYLYKAKRKNWKELPKEDWWVKRYLWVGNDFSCITPHNVGISYYKDTKRVIAFSYEVDPDTVCEYTGIPDKSGSKIFENDICRYRNSIVRILWSKKHQWGAEILESNSALSKGLIFPLWQYGNCEENGNRELEVIGNIFDNLELAG